MCPIIRSTGLWWLCNCICLELYENIRGKQSVTSPIRRTLPTSIVVAIETMQKGEALSSHRPQTGKLRPREGELGLIAWAGKSLLSPIATLLLGLPLGQRDSSFLGEEEGLCSSLPPGWGLTQELPKPCLLLGNHY